MKHAVSVSIGSSRRDKSVEIKLFGETVLLERIGTDGDMQKAASLFREFDGKVDALGVGGTDLGLMVADHWYRLESVKHLVQDVHHTPVVDGTGLKTTLEYRAGKVVDEQLGSSLKGHRALITTATDRWGMASGFLDRGYEMRYGDLMYSLGAPVMLRSARMVKLLARILFPILGRVPFHWLYPTGAEQEKRTPRGEKYFLWADVIMGDCHYVRKYMPNRMDGKVVVTNTTTPEDTAIFRAAGVRHLVTTTPVLDGRSFGTNMMEAGIIAATGRTEPVDYAHPGNYFTWMDSLVNQLGLNPQIHEI
ncbi:MAG TPA: hypothetical protein VIO61_15130 [Anaerolineaceae bacterium]